MVIEFDAQYGFQEVHTTLDGPWINQSNREFQPCYTIKGRIGPEKHVLEPT